LPKTLDGLIRPRLSVTGVLCHGYLGALHFADENVSHGSDAFCEVLMLTLVRVAHQCREQGKRFPRHLVIQSDNTVAQAKNSIVTLFLASLVHLGYFCSATINFLMVGHTHEDIDQLFGLMVEWLSRRHSWETPEEVMQFLQDKMRRHFTDRGEQFIVERLTAIRDYQAWSAPVGTKLYNAFGTRGGIEAPHSFALKRRQDLTQAEWRVHAEDELSLEAQLRAPGAPGAPGVPGAPGDLDIYCCVKTYMRDTALQQAPLLTICVAEVGPWEPKPTVVLRVKPWTGKTMDMLLSLADLCQHEFHMPKAALALHHLAVDREYNLPAQNWLDVTLPDQRGPADSGNPYFPHLPASSWRLLARPQRRRAASQRSGG
jgi:hypothetical protein